MQLVNKTIIITGANQGFGLAIAKEFAKQGANLVLSARNYSLLEEVKIQIKNEFNIDVRIIKSDVSNIEDNKKTAELAIREFGTIDVFVANAGIYGPKGSTEAVNLEEWSNAIDINLKGVVYGCASVIHDMKKNRSGKIIILSGGGATKPMPFLSSYAASKAGVVRFMESLSLEVNEFNIDVNAIAPGALNTRLLKEVLDAGPDLVGAQFYEQSLKQVESGGAGFVNGVNLCLFLASVKSNKITGKLISAIWDKWESFDEKLNELINSDIYTLRRIIPEDRNKNWN